MVPLPFFARWCFGIRRGIIVVVVYDFKLRKICVHIFYFILFVFLEYVPLMGIIIYQDINKMQVIFKGMRYFSIKLVHNWTINTRVES